MPTELDGIGWAKNSKNTLEVRCKACQVVVRIPLRGHGAHELFLPLIVALRKPCQYSCKHANLGNGWFFENGVLQKK